MKGAFTLLEMIFVIVIAAILSIGTFKAIEMLYLKSAKTKAVTDMTLRSQIVLDQLGIMLYNRIPNSVIGYTQGGECQPIAELTGSHPILEWLGTMDDELLQREYDGFIDLGSSDKETKTLKALSISKDLNITATNLIFAGAFDDAANETYKACGGAFGWHGNDSNLSYAINITTDDEIILTDDDAYQPQFIYEKYYLTNTAYAVARGEALVDTDVRDDCNYDISKLDDFNTTLFLFYDYQPFDGETFCGDGGSGKVTVLAESVNAFEAIYENDIIRLNLDMNRSIRGSQSVVHIYKQKAVY